MFRIEDIKDSNSKFTQNKVYLTAENINISQLNVQFVHHADQSPSNRFCLINSRNS